MRGKPLFLSICGLAVLAGGLLAGRAAWTPQPEQAPESIAEQNTPETAAVSEPANPAPAPHARPVAPDVVAITPVPPEALVRIDPRQPLSPFGRPLPPRPKDNSHILRPLADAAGRITGAGIAVTIAGVGVVEADAACTDTNGSDWPCGMRARTAFRGFLRGRSVACDIPPDFDGKSITTSCALGAFDLGRWIVANGWGHAEPGGPYIDDEKEAKTAGKGIFGTAPEPLPALSDPAQFDFEPEPRPLPDPRQPVHRSGPFQSRPASP